MLWIAVYLPELSLEVVNRAQAGQAREPVPGALTARPSAAIRGGAPGAPPLPPVPAPTAAPLLVDLPVAVSDGPAQRPFVLAANAPARAAGVRPGQPIAAACALVSGLVVVSRSEPREQQAIAQVAAWAAQFTPTVALQPRGVLLEVAASLTLFGGLARLLGQLRGGLSGLGYRAALGVAPTPRAAWLLARARLERTVVRACLSPAELPQRLGELPTTLLDWPRETLEALATLGATRVGDVLALPREGLRRRFGAALLADLDRALGRTPDPRACFVLPERFDSRIDLPGESTGTDRLQVPLVRMLDELEGFLRARGAGALRLVVMLEHGYGVPPSRLEIGAQVPERSRLRWWPLVRERLGRHALPAAVSAVGLRVDALHDFSDGSETFLPDAQRRSREWQSLSERIAARCGPGALFLIELREDHRPEHAWQRTDAAVLPSRSRGAPSALPGGARPLFLLERPRALVNAAGRPQHQGPLELLSGPERIESGWWDGRSVARDYYVARNRAGEACWIYREPADPSRWFLHGLFG